MSDTRTDLEREAIEFYNSIPTWARSAGLRGFLGRLADHLNWTNLKGIL
jgi:rubrerythrin